MPTEATCRGMLLLLINYYFHINKSWIQHGIDTCAIMFSSDLLQTCSQLKCVGLAEAYPGVKSSVWSQNYSIDWTMSHTFLDNYMYYHIFKLLYFLE